MPEEDKDIKLDGAKYKAERKGKRNTILIACGVGVVLETVLLFIFATQAAFSSMLSWLLPLLCSLILVEAATALLTMRFFKRVLALTDYEAGLEYEKLLMEREAKIKERDSRDDHPDKGE
jgi:hypothetical protein